jgi:calcineurin-like phosphoesterase family protein
MEIKNLPVDKLYFTSDTHFGHTNIIKYCNRPYDTVEEMDEGIIKIWNKVVPKDGIVFHLGDFTFKGSKAIQEYRSQLNGTIYLCEGNHDNGREVRKSGCFHQIADIYDLTLQDDEMPEGKQEIVCCHYPIFSHKNSSHGAFHFHGHLHGLAGLNKISAVDVGIDVWQQPMTYQELKTHITKKYLNK